MAPEQLEKPLTVDCRADIYSVGVVFYEMLTGELPLGKFPPPSQKAHSDARLDHVVLQALEKDPAMRYQNVSEVKSAVESIASAPPKLTMPVKTPPIKTSPLQPGMSRTAKVVIAVSGVAFVLLAACVCVFVIGLIGTKPVAPSSINSKTYWDLLSEDQRAVVEHTENKFHSVLERRDFAGWSPQRLADLENASLQKIKNPPAPTSNPNDYFRAINTLAALRSVKAVPELLNIVSAHTDKLVWTEKANRDRCMATRALGLIGNKEGTVPQIIPLLYHPNISTRWWAQIALVQLTGQNFGGDWNAWAKWWNAQNLPPPIGSDLVRWWSGQEDPTKLMSMMTELNRTYFDGVSGQPESVSGTNTTTKPNNMSFTLEMQDTAKILHNPAETDIRSALASHKDDFGPVLVIKTDGTTDFIRVVAEQDGHFSFQHSPDGKIVFVSKKETFSVDEATKVAAGYAKGLPDWKNLVEWKELK
jgi:hypothetical protein